MSSTDGTLLKLTYQAGFHRETTRYTEEGKWFDGDKVRFREGRPENLRGWVKRVDTPFDGTARDLRIWSDNNTRRLASFGTEKKLYVYDGNNNVDITPIVSSTTFTSAFATQATSFLVSVSSASHNRVIGDFVLISSSTTIGGSIVLGTSVYEIISVTDDDNFTISAATAASATQTSAGEGTGQFLLETGSNIAIAGLGFGAGVYNAGVSVTGERAWDEPAESSNIILQGTQWSLDNWGEDLIVCRRGGKIYYWDRDATASPSRAVVVTASPAQSNSILVSPNDRHVISLGATGFAADYSPLRVRWSDQEDYTNWTPSVSSTSGEVELTDGTRIIGGVRSRNQINIWTDKSMYGMTYVGNPFVFQFRQLGTNCGLLGQHACVDYDGRAFWMSDDNFYSFDGQVRNLRSTVRRYVFDNINFNQLDKVYAGVNSEFKEIIWLYPSSQSTECDSYVIYNPEENHWVYGTCKWTTFKDRNVYDNTITTGSDSYLYDNEPVDIYTGDNETIPNFCESSDFDVEEGMDMIFIDKLIPDFEFNDGTIAIKITTKEYPTGPETVKGPYYINAGTRKVDLRARGRQARIRVSAASNNTYWRWGAVRISGQRDGNR
jgi:acyl-[acyl carrier protein]--UDP-N-acetylglucosamine O-acyltransferase